MSVLVQLLLNGLLLGGLYAIISVGLTLIFGIVRVVNFAHGEFLMASMYGAYLLSTKLGMHPYVSALPLIVVFFFLGALVQRFIIDPLLDSDAHVQIFATVGLSTALLNLALLVFGANMQSIAPSGAQRTIALGEYRLVLAHLIMFVVAIALVLTAVFVPTVFITGISGQFYRQFALTIAISTVISAINSLTLSPALAANVHKSKSPVMIVPVCITPFVSGPPSSPAETTTGSPVLASVSR